MAETNIVARDIMMSKIYRVWIEFPFQCLLMVSGGNRQQLNRQMDR